MQIHTTAAHYPALPPVAPAFRPLLRTLSEIISEFGAIRAAAHFRFAAETIFVDMAKAYGGDAAVLDRLAARDLTVNDLDAAGLYFAQRARELDARGLH